MRTELNKLEDIYNFEVCSSHNIRGNQLILHRGKISTPLNLELKMRAKTRKKVHFLRFLKYFRVLQRGPSVISKNVDFSL